MFCDGLYGTLLFLDIAYSLKKKKTEFTHRRKWFQMSSKNPKKTNAKYSSNHKGLLYCHKWGNSDDNNQPEGAD